MHAVAFDTLEAAKRLRAAGFDETQSDALVGAFASNMLQGLASKDDLTHLEESIRKDMLHMEERLDARLAQQDARMAQLEERMNVKLAKLEERMNVKFGRIEDNLGYRLTVRMAGTIIVVFGGLRLLEHFFFLS